MQEAVAAVQAAQPTWTEADLIRHLGERLPADLGVTSAGDTARLLPDLARRALATEAVLLSAPKWPRVPDCLRRGWHVPTDMEYRPSARPATGGPGRLANPMDLMAVPQLCQTGGAKGTPVIIREIHMQGVGLGWP